jgi:hypothetical protein
MSTKFLSPGWRMPRNANQSKQSNYSMDFNGSSYINVGNDTILQFQPTDAFTLSCWFNASSYSSNSIIVSNNEWSGAYRGYNLQLKSTGALQFTLTSNYVSSSNNTNINIVSTTTINTGTWYHLVITKDTSIASTGLNMYINGSLASATKGSGGTLSAFTYASDFNIGGADNGSQLFNGKIGAVCVFNYALSASQVTTLWGGGTSVSNPMALPIPPKAYYPLGTSAWDGNFLAENNAIGDYVFSFDGGGESSGGGFINCGDNSSFNITSALSISGWFNTSSSDDYRMIITKDGNTPNRAWLLTMYGSGGGVLYFRVFETGASADNSPVVTTTNGYNDGKWHFFTATYEPSTAIKIYVDNDAVVSNTTGIPSSIVSLPSQDVKIGTYGVYDGSSGRRWDGELSNIQIFNTALSSTDVATLYNYGSPIRTLANIPQSSNLIAWYKLNATEIYNSSTTKWEISNAVAAIKATALQNAPTFTGLKAPTSVITNGVQALSFSAWIYYPGSFSTGKYLRILNAQQDLYIGNFESNNLVFKNGATYIATFNAQIIPGQWNHIAVSTEMTSNLRWTSKIRLNGGAVETKTGPGASGINTALFTADILVTAWGYGNPGYSGTVLTSNSIIWDNKALTDSELLDVYNAFSVSNGIPTVQPSSISSFPQSASISGWYKLDDSPLVDSSGNNNTLIPAGGGTAIGPGVANGNGQSSGMSQSNLVQSDLQTVAPYSKYALDFDGTNDLITISNESNFDFDRTDSFSISCWFKCNNASANNHIINKLSSTGDYTGYNLFINNTDSKLWFYLRHDYTSPNQIIIKSDSALVSNVWYNLVVTYDGSSTAAGCKMYIDNVNVSNTESDTLSSSILNNEPLRIGGRSPSTSNFANGSISNVSIWNAALTSAQIREIYNEGLPSNLNSHSAYSNLVSWWQLGSNSSWTGNRWIVADEKGTNNGYSQNMAPYMPESGLTNGVGTTANGVSSGMAVGALVGDAPYSTANAISNGMAVIAKGTNVP